MAKPLFTKREVDDYLAARNKLEWKDWEKFKGAHELKMVRRAQARPREYLDALIILVGSHGEFYVPFEHAFASSAKPEFVSNLAEFNTPEARRDLHTILKALTEVPKSWASSALTRFFRGIGKQRGAKYHGAGLLGTSYGWKGQGVSVICRELSGAEESYAKVLMSYVDLEAVEADQKAKIPDYEPEEPLPFGATCAERDVEFLNRLCEMLEADGLGPIPTPQHKEPKKRVPKVFKPGDVIRKNTLRDLPLPAQVRIQIERLPAGMAWRDSKESDWKPATIDQVVITIDGHGGYTYASIGSDQARAHKSDHFNWQSKDWLYGATYVGPWKGQLINSRLKINFEFRRPEKKGSSK